MKQNNQYAHNALIITTAPSIHNLWEKEEFVEKQLTNNLQISKVFCTFAPELKK